MNRIYKVIAFLLILFLVDAILVTTNVLIGFDDTMYRGISFVRNDFTDAYFKNITMLGNANVVLLIIVILNMILTKRKAFVMDCLVINCVFTNIIIKYLFRRDRPDVLRLIDIGGYSFPSGHSMITITLYGFLFYLVITSKMRQWLKIILGLILIFLIISICVSRIYVGVHYASDVLGGFILGLAELLITIYLSKRFLGGVEEDVQTINK